MCRELHGKSKRVFRLLFARCILSSSKSLSTFLLLLCKNLPATSWNNLQLLQCLCKREVLGEPAEKLCSFGSRWELTQILSWEWVDFQLLHWAVSFHCFCAFLSPYVLVLLYRETERDVHSATESAKCWCFLSPSHCFLFKEQTIR